MDSTRPISVAFIGARGVIGTYSGIETYYEEVGSRLAAKGHRVTAYCRKHFTPDVREHRGIAVRRLPSLTTKHGETISHSILSTLDALFRGYDIVQFHAIGSAPLALLPRLFGTKTVVSVRGLDWQRAKWGFVARKALQFGELASARCPTATAVVSETLRDHYRKRHGRTPTVIQNAVLRAEPRPADKLFDYGLEPGKFILFAGRISPEKQVDRLIEAAKPLLGDVKLAIAGGSSYSDDYIAKVRELADDNVVFLGQVDHETVYELYCNCLTFVLPSVMEGLSIALLEAVSFGTCIVTTDIPENREVVGDAGLYFDVGSTEELRERLSQLIENPSLAESLRSAARERAALQLDWDDVAELTEAFYRKLLGREVTA
ncbi:MAG: glycosyltransferase family 4 protein [Acidobacteriota bacterium]